jgi:hypothetical protein
MIKREFITLWELEKMFHLFSNSIDVLEILGQGGMRFEKSFKSYSNNQWLLRRGKKTWFNIADTLHVLMLNQNIINERILITFIN